MKQNKEMKSKNPLKKLAFLILVLLYTIAGFSLVNASTGLTVVLANQNPDPVAPGNIVTLNVKVSNSGSTPIPEASISYLENSNIKLQAGEKKNKRIRNNSLF